MPSLYDTLLPRIQAINEEGGNMVGFLISKPILDMVDAGANADPSLGRIRVKILDAIKAHQDKRDHKGFSAIFNFYSEAVVYLSMRARGLDIQALSEGGDKTPDFVTRSVPVVGFELKTIDVHRPAETYDRTMNEGFEAGYEALERARAGAKNDDRGIGVGTSISIHAPHGMEAGPKEAMVQTIRKIRSNISAGQYKAQPTILVVSLVRIGLSQQGVHLRRWQDEDEDFGGRQNGHLYTIAAHQFGDPYYDYGRVLRPEPYDLGPLDEAGILHDHPFIAGIVFVETTWSETGSTDVLTKGLRFNGIWNSGWEASSEFTDEQKAEAKLHFEQLCHAWNDTTDSRDALIPDIGKLHADLIEHVTSFTRRRKGTTPSANALQDFVAEADRLYVVWKAAELLVDPSQHTPINRANVRAGHAINGGYPVISYEGPSSHPGIPKLELARPFGSWHPSKDVGPVKWGVITL